MYVQTSKQRGKKLAVHRGRVPWQWGDPSHGTTGTMVNPALVTLYLFLYNYLCQVQGRYTFASAKYVGKITQKVEDKFSRNFCKGNR